MDLETLFDPTEQPLDHLADDGGFAAIFRTIACVGDSLSSGEFESLDASGTRHYHDMFEFSWGQYMGRALGSNVYNFSRGGMTAREYMESFAENCGFWDPEKRSQAYLLALGANDITEAMNGKTPFGSVEDIAEDYHNNAHTFVGYFSMIVSRLKEIQPDAKFFFLTMPHSGSSEDRSKLEDLQQTVMHQLAERFSNSYVIDLRKYAPVYDKTFRDRFYMSGHLNPAGYLLTAKMIQSYLDYLIRHNLSDFRKVGFIGTPFVNVSYD